MEVEHEKAGFNRLILPGLGSLGNEFLLAGVLTRWLIHIEVYVLSRNSQT